MSESLHIRSLEIVDFKRIKAATIKPDGSPLVIIGGRNGQGKSSVLDAILSALAGGSHDPAEPVRRGGKRAEVWIERVGDQDPGAVIIEDGEVYQT